ncbi:MAG: hypothetical protein K8L97_10960 [Anaerolineae bacterium]|nr:hypothetical protein [Anaerolineae bacterium]
MTDNELRISALGVIWGAYTVIMVASLAAAETIGSGMILVLAVLLAMVALSGTRIAWRYSAPWSLAEAEKAKRLSKVEQFMQHLSDQELDELRSRLTDGADGEMVSLDEVLAERRRR